MPSPDPSQSLSLIPKPPNPSREDTPSLNRFFADAVGNPKIRSLSYAASAAAIPSVQPRFSDLDLPPRQYGMKDGIHSVTFSQNEIQAANQNLRNTLVAKFQMGRPSLSAIRDFAKTNWRTKGRVTMNSNWDDRHVVFIFDLEEDVTTALVCPYRRVNHTYFRLFRWTPQTRGHTDHKMGSPTRPPNAAFQPCNGKGLLSSCSNFLDLDDSLEKHDLAQHMSGLCGD